MEDNFYKIRVDNLQSREKNKSNLQNEVTNLRERCMTQLIQLQDLVHPKKWIVLAEVTEFIQSKAECLKHTDNTRDCVHTPNYKTKLDIDLNKIKSVIKEANDFLENTPIDDTTV